MATNHILVANPNTNSQTTEAMTALVAEALTDTGLTARGVTAGEGPTIIDNPAALVKSARQVVASLEGTVSPKTRGIIVAAIGDPGVVDCRERWGLPTIGLGEASIHAAAQGHRRFGLVTSTVALAPSLAQLIERHGSAATFAGFRFTASPAAILAGDESRTYQELFDAVHQSIDLDHAERVIIGGGPLSLAATHLTREFGSRIVIPVVCATSAIVQQLNIAQSN